MASLIAFAIPNFLIGGCDHHYRNAETEGYNSVNGYDGAVIIWGIRDKPPA